MSRSSRATFDTPWHVDGLPDCFVMTESCGGVLSKEARDGRAQHLPSPKAEEISEMCELEGGNRAGAPSDVIRYGVETFTQGEVDVDETETQLGEEPGRTTDGLSWNYEYVDCAVTEGLKELDPMSCQGSDGNEDPSSYRDWLDQRCAYNSQPSGGD